MIKPNKAKFNKLLAIQFDLKPIKNAYPSIVKKLTKLFKKLNDLIIANFLIENNKKTYLSEYIFNYYIFQNNCPPTLSEFKNMQKKYKASQYEINYYYEIYSYNLLKYTEKSKNYATFIQLFLKQAIIKIKNQNIQKTFIKDNKEQVGAITNNFIFAFFCKNGCNYIKIKSNYLTPFTYNLCKQNNIQILFNNQNLLEDSNYFFYKNNITLDSNKAKISISLLNNNLKFKVVLKQNGDIKFLFDKNFEVKKHKNKFELFKDNTKCALSINLNSKLISTTEYIGFDIVEAKKEFEINLLVDGFISNKLANIEHLQLQSQLKSYYSCANNKLNLIEFQKISQNNFKFPIKHLNTLNNFKFYQCYFELGVDEKIIIDRLNFNEKEVIPLKKYYHLCTDGKIFIANDVKLNQQLIFLDNCSYLCLDISSPHYYYSVNGKSIKIITPLQNQQFIVSTQSKIKNVNKIYNFLLIYFEECKSKHLLKISNTKEKIEGINIYKYFLNFKNIAKNNLKLDLCNLFFNITILTNKINQFNIFSEEFAILHQKFNKKCTYNPFFYSFSNKHEVLDLFLSYTSWSQKYYNFILDYIYSLKEYNAKLILKNNLLIILQQCYNLDLNKFITYQIGQLNKTIIDNVLEGDFQFINYVSNFYYCYIYFIFYDKIITNDELCYNKDVLKLFSNIVLYNNNQRYVYNIKQSNKNVVQIGNVDFIGFNKIHNKSSVTTIYI